MHHHFPLGECDKQHVDTLKKEYETAYKRGNVDFQREWLYTLRDFVASCDKKIRSAQARLDKNPEDRRATELVRRIYFEMVVYVFSQSQPSSSSSFSRTYI